MPPFLCLLFKHLAGAGQEPFGVNSIVGYHVESIPSRPSQKATKYQNVKIETLLKFRDVISDSKIELLEAMQAEGVTLVVLPGY